MQNAWSTYRVSCSARARCRPCRRSSDERARSRRPRAAERLLHPGSPSPSTNGNRGPAFRGYGIAAAWAPASGSCSERRQSGSTTADGGRRGRHMAAALRCRSTLFTALAALVRAPFVGIGAANRDGMSLLPFRLVWQPDIGEVSGDAWPSPYIGSSFYS